MKDLAARIAPLVAGLYAGKADQVTQQLVVLAEGYAKRLSRQEHRPLDQSTAVLIRYGDTVRRPGEAPLATLHRLLTERVGDVITDVHLLPM